MNTDMQKTIFIVDPTATNLIMVEKTLAKHCRVISFSSATMVFKALDNVKPDLILLSM